MPRNRTAAAAEPLHFFSEVGHEVSFFVPDTGAPGATAKVKGPSETITVEEYGRFPGHEARTVEGKEGELPAVGPRVGFQLPKFTEPGEHTVTIDQEGDVIVYVFTVGDRSSDNFEADYTAWKRAHSGEGEEG